MIPIMIIIILLVNFSIGFFGVIHTGILNSIAARNYAFETFRHRSNLVYFATNSEANTKVTFEIDQSRMHVTNSDKTVNQGLQSPIATSRLIDFVDFSRRQADEVGGPIDHKAGIDKVRSGVKFLEQGVNPVWIKTAYGICLNLACSSI
jgi:hypothetical protein